MSLAKKIIGIIIAGLLIIFSICAAILTFQHILGMVELFKSLDFTHLSKDQIVLFAGSIFRVFSGIAITLSAGIGGGIGLFKAIIGRPESILKRGDVFVSFEFISISGYIIYFLSHFNDYNDETRNKIVTYIIALFAFILATTILLSLGRRRAINNNGHRIAGGILISIAAVLMFITLHIINNPYDEIIVFREGMLFTEDELNTVKNLYPTFTTFSIFGTIGILGLGVFNIIQGALEGNKKEE